MILSIDASTTGCSVAVFNNFRVISTVSSRVDRTSAENLTLMIEQSLKLANIKFQDLKAVAVAKGPGSYTGLRIAVSTAKGLAFGLDLPLIGFGTLQAMCNQIAFTASADLLCPMIDARRMEVFCGFFSAETKTPVCEIQAVLVNEASFSDILNHKRVLFFGEGSEKCRAVLTQPNALFANALISPSAEASCSIVCEKFESGDFEDIVLFEPFYLKEYMFKTK